VRRLLLFVSCLFVAVPASAEWYQARTGHFIVYSESNANDTKEFAQKLERFDMALRTLQGMQQKPADSDAERLTVYRFGEQSDIGRLAGASMVAGFYIPREGGSVAFTPARDDGPTASIIRRDSRTDLDPMSVLLHEYTHHFMFQHFPATYPSWYVEGIAELYSTIDFRPDGSFHLGNPPQARAEPLVGKYRSLLHYSIRQMLLTKSRPTGEDAYAHYTYGWLLTHYLAFEPTRKGQMLTYLRLIDQGTSLQDAAQQAFGDLDKLEAEVMRYKNGGRYYGRDVKFSNYHPPSVEMRKVGPDEEAILPVVTKSKVGVSHRTAGGVAGDARSVASKYPNSFPVQLELAEAELDAENLYAAERAADAAIALKPDSAEALYFKGNILLAKAKKDPKFYPVARSWFAKAHDADPDHPGPLVGNFLTFSKAGGPIPETAVIGLEEAYRIAPQDGELKIILAREELAEKRLDVAKMLLVPLALSPHESKGAKTMNDIVQLIDAKNAAGALAKMDEFIKKAEEDEKKGD